MGTLLPGCGGHAGFPTTPASREQAANVQEAALAALIEHDARQGRPAWHRSDVLARAARARAEDFARRGYFADTDPDGVGANAYVRQAGYTLPAAYRTEATANEVESIGAGSADTSVLWNTLLGKRNTRLHLLGSTPFFAEQTEYGIGYVHDDASVLGDYWVVLTAPPEGDSLSGTVLPH